MHKIKTVLRLAGLGLSQRQIAVSCQVGQATVSDYLRMAAAAGLKWPDIADWDEDRLRTALAPGSVPAPGWRKTDDPDFAQIRRELQTHKHLTLQLLWQEYREKHPNGYGYSRYCGLYRNWLKRQDVVLRHEHRAGEKLFVDYAGDTIPVHDPTTGEVRAAAVFVAVLGASSYTYAEATWTQGLADWIGAHLRTFEFVGGTPEILVPDFVPGHKIRVLWRTALCGRGAQNIAKRALEEVRWHITAGFGCMIDFRSGFPNGGCHARALFRQAVNGRPHPRKLVSSGDRTLRRMDGITWLCRPELLPASPDTVSVC